VIRCALVARTCAGFVLAAVALSVCAGSAWAQTAPGGSFGTPPSGEIPILFNDEHVYAKPDTLRANRVLTALVRDGVIFVPLRSMFERMGASVAWDAASRTATISKPGSEVKVTLGKPVVTLNGEDRPLDVAPMVYRGVIVVPIRVISEGIGAYVQWVPDRRIVVVRFLSAPVPPPSAAPVTSPSPAPVATPIPTPLPAMPSPAPTPIPAHFEAFVAGDYQISPKVYNELSPGNTATGSYALHGAIEFPLFGASGMIEGDYRHDAYEHTALQSVGACAPGVAAAAGCGTVVGNQVYQSGICPSTTDPGCVTVVGFQQIIAFNGLGQAYVPAFHAEENAVDARLGFKIADPRVYVGAGYLVKSYNYLGYPRIAGAGFGATKLPDLDRPVSLEGSFWYYPSLSGNYTYPTTPFLGPLSGKTISLTYSYWKYRAGAAIDLGHSGLFFDLGVMGERANARTNAPSNTTVNAPYAGLGVHL
jgi:hypothetical protein